MLFRDASGSSRGVRDCPGVWEYFASCGAVLRRKRLAESRRGVEMGPGKRRYRSEAMEFLVASTRVTLTIDVFVYPASTERGGVFASGVCCGIVLPPVFVLNSVRASANDVYVCVFFVFFCSSVT